MVEYYREIIYYKTLKPARFFKLRMSIVAFCIFLCIKVHIFKYSSENIHQQTYFPFTMDKTLHSCKLLN